VFLFVGIKILLIRMLPYDVWIKTQEFMEALHNRICLKDYPVIEKKTSGPVIGLFEKYEDPETGEILYMRKKPI
jgi:hypothetical protein